MKKIILISAMSLFCLSPKAQSLDLSFGKAGVVTTDVGLVNDCINAIAIQDDGKIIAAGYKIDSDRKNFAVTRYATDGSLDKTFGGSGIISTMIGSDAESAFSVAIQDDGKILIVGYKFHGLADYSVLLIRYNTNGSLDNTFDSDGILSTNLALKGGIGRSVVVQPDGKILIAGECTDGIKSFVFIARLETDGSFDKSFDTDGIMTTTFDKNSNLAYALTLDADGKIVLAGASGLTIDELGFAVLRCHPDGSLDNTFDGDGKQLTYIGAKNSDAADAIAIQPDGKILLAGYSTGDDLTRSFAIARYHKDGSLDNTLDADGVKTLRIGKGGSYARSVAVQADGKILLGGASVPETQSDFTLLRLKSDGSLDNTFNVNGIVTTDVLTQNDVTGAMAIQSDGKIILGGCSQKISGGQLHFSMVRYNLIPTKTNIISADTEPEVVPNPFNTKTRIVFHQQLDNACISITDCLGRQVRKIDNVTGPFYEIERNGLPAGVYLVQLSQSGARYPVFKLLVQD